MGRGLSLRLIAVRFQKASFFLNAFARNVARFTGIGISDTWSDYTGFLEKSDSSTSMVFPGFGPEVVAHHLFGRLQCPSIENSLSL